ncbi:formate hydrogenlyase subunit E [Escherichia coli]|nr:formate hydrogenlyase subunit E [Escherichia coli]
MRHFRASCWTHAWQTKDQLTVTVKVNYLPEVVEFLYYKQGGWLSVLFGNDERKLNGHYAVYYVLSMEKGTKWLDYGSRRS